MTVHKPLQFTFDNSYARLPERFYERLEPTPVKAPRIVKLNENLTRELGLDPAVLSSPEGVDVLAGNRVPEGSDPIATAYAGHQFGGWVPQLGDGRAVLLGEVVDSAGVRRDIQLKGAGRTRFSRQGDGRAWIGPVLREYIVSEAMAALDVPTTRALAVVLTGEWIYREGPMPGAVLTRVASSHIRVGTFQFFAARGDIEALRLLADHAIDRHYPAARDEENPHLALLQNVIVRQVELVARWLHVGFIHGVMNTDNVSIAGETIDYGPCAFMDDFRPDMVFSSIDRAGRYAYQNQPSIAQWNLAVFASSILPLIADDEKVAVAAAQSAVDAFPRLFEHAYLTGMCAKLGFAGMKPGDGALVQDLLRRMAESSADFTLVFRHLSSLPALAAPDADNAVRGLFSDPSSFDAWAEQWRRRLAQETRSDEDRQAAMRTVNPASIPRNHRVEAVIQAALDDDFAPFETLLAVLSHPYDDQPDSAEFTAPPAREEIVHQTFCGT